MQALETLMSRQSARAVTLGAPAPAGDDLGEILQAGMSAPDHGAIRPWRFKLIDGEAREKLGDIFADALQKRDPAATAEMIENIRSKPMRSPLIVTVCADIMDDHPKVPAVEQVLAAGCAAQNIMNAAHAMGYGAIMLTGWMAYDATVKAALGLAEKDAIIAFIYMGTPSENGPVKPRPEYAQFTSVWTG